MAQSNIKIVAVNKKARFNYFIETEYEAGLQLTGTEVKSLRQGRANLKDSYCKIHNGEVFVHQMHIGPYPFAHYGNHEPLRRRKLLLHKWEIKKLYGKVNEKGYALIPLKLYFKHGRAKLGIGLGRGKQKHDKRETIRRVDQEREMARTRRAYGVK